MSVAMTYSSDKLVVTIGGKPYFVHRSDRNFGAVAKAINEGKSDQEVLDAINNGVNLTSYLKGTGRVTYVNGVVYYDGKELHNSLVNRVQMFAEAGLPVNYLLSFIENVEQNPSFNSRNQLYNFLEHSDIVLSDDGCFIAYKAVRGDYKDKYSGTIDNNVGRRVVMDRSKIDDNPGSHCSYGLHVGSVLYAGPGGFYNSHGDRTMLVKVNPKDVVSVPNDHSCQKCRVCEYLVIGEVTGKLDAPLYTSDGKPYDYDKPTPVGFDGFYYEDDDDYDSDDGYSYDEEDDYENDSEIDYDDDDDFEVPPSIRL